MTWLLLPLLVASASVRECPPTARHLDRAIMREWRPKSMPRKTS
jgi:hypothetical protein